MKRLIQIGLAELLLGLFGGVRISQAQVAVVGSEPLPANLEHVSPDGAYTAWDSERRYQEGAYSRLLPLIQSQLCGRSRCRTARRPPIHFPKRCGSRSLRSWDAASGHAKIRRGS